MKNCLLLGRKAIIVDDLAAKINVAEVKFFAGTGLQDVKSVMAENPIQVVIMGAGLLLEDRPEIIRYIFETSKSTTVHMKDWDSGPTGMVPFVEQILQGVNKE